MTTANTIETIDRASRRIVELVKRVNVLSAQRANLLATSKALLLARDEWQAGSPAIRTAPFYEALRAAIAMAESEP